MARKNKVIRSTIPVNLKPAGDSKNPEKVKPSSKTARPKTTRTRTQKDVARKTTVSKSKAPRAGPSDEQIRMRAYFISERRRRFDLPGDANDDWLEAKRQLLSQFGPR